MRNWLAKVRPYWTHWIEIVLAAAVVVVAAAVGTAQIFIYKQQAKIMGSQAEIAQKQADIMNTQADIAQRQLAEMQSEGRAWVSIEPFLGNVTWDKEGVNINIKMTVKNTGKIPALYVVRDAKLLPTIASESPYTVLQKMITQQRQGPIDITGVPVFPNDTLDWFAVFKYSRDDVKKNFEYRSTFRNSKGETSSLKPEDHEYISLTLVYFVDYTFGGDFAHHQHSCMCNIVEVFPNVAARFALPLGVDLSPPNVQLDSFPFNCQAD